MIKMEANFSEPGEEGVYIPTTVDSSIRDILVHRGVPEPRIAALLDDLDGKCSLAEYELEAILPCNEMTFKHIYMHQFHILPCNGMTFKHIYMHQFHVLLARNVIWTGESLTLQNSLPETVVAALPGRSLRDVVSHPCLPDRSIISAEIDEYGRLIIKVPPDPVPVIELSRASDLIISAIPTRSRMRRAWIDRKSRAKNESSWWAWLGKQKADSVRDFLEGKPQIFGPHCWGGMVVSPMPIARLGIHRLHSALQGLLHRIRTEMTASTI